MTVTSDLTITGEAGFGTSAPRARLDVKIDAADNYAIKVSSQNGNVLLSIDNAGDVAVGLEAAGARLDVTGVADDGSIGLQLRAGNSSNTVTSSQFVFALSGTQTFRQSIRSQHDETQENENAIDFYLWNSTGSPNTLGNVHVLSIRASSTTTGSVHVMPAGAAPFELVVSDGQTIGGGTMQRGEWGIPSSREIKTDIRYLRGNDMRRAYEELKSLKHKIFRYKGGRSPWKRGLIYEEAPDSIRGPSGTISLDQRLVLMEMAMKEVHERLTAVDRTVTQMERGDSDE
ncbi:MAG: hypothetical protein COB53_03240 [Elusimicrobia bacterium]|nr:MAG: hypothetical protein COB53_03240 [Elusimicrobiota bacterium]